MHRRTRIALITLGALALSVAVALSATFALTTRTHALRPLADVGMIVAYAPERTR